jgi:hypothetical protein
MDGANNQTPRSSPLIAVTDCHRARIPVSSCLILETIIRSIAVTFCVLIILAPCVLIAQPCALERQRTYHEQS